MFLFPVIESSVNFSALAAQVDMTEADLKGSTTLDKLSIMSSGMFCLNVSQQLITLTYYFELPIEVVDFMCLSDLLKINRQDLRFTTKGFVTASLADFVRFVQEYSTATTPPGLRLVANQLYSSLKEKYHIFLREEVRMLSDKTFTLKSV